LTEIKLPDNSLAIFFIILAVLAVIGAVIYICGFSKWKRIDGKRLLKRQRHPYKAAHSTD